MRLLSAVACMCLAAIDGSALFASTLCTDSFSFRGTSNDAGVRTTMDDPLVKQMPHTASASPLVLALSDTLMAHPHWAHRYGSMLSQASELGFAVNDIQVSLVPADDHDTQAFGVEARGLGSGLTQTKFRGIAISIRSMEGEEVVSYDFDSLGLALSSGVPALVSLWSPADGELRTPPLLDVHRVVDLAFMKFLMSKIFLARGAKPLRDVIADKLFDPIVRASAVHPITRRLRQLEAFLKRSVDGTDDAMMQALRVLSAHIAEHKVAFSAHNGEVSQDEVRMLAQRTEIAILLKFSDLLAEEGAAEFLGHTDALLTLPLRRVISLQAHQDDSNLHLSEFRRFANAIARLDPSNDKVFIDKLCRDEVSRILSFSNSELISAQLLWYRHDMFTNQGKRSAWLALLVDVATDRFSALR